MIQDQIKQLKNQVILGKYLNLRIAREEDAAFILELRLDPILNKFISKTDPSVEKQIEWIKKVYNKDNDFTFIIEDKKSNKCGTVAIYDIDYSTGRAEWGRLIIKQHALFILPIEATIQLLNFAFNTLHLKQLYGGANNLNKQVVDFHKIYADVSSEEETHTWFTFEEKNLVKISNRYKNFHNIQISV
jgi:RimJ/RimL family protein N-acetyltransferase